MCLALVAQDAHPAFALVIAANRDEHHARPATPAAWWAEGWLAGRDLEAGGTWLGVTPAGRWALITNIREPDRRDPGAPSRGALVTRVLGAAASPQKSVAAIVANAAAYNGFNLLAGDTTSACWGSNRSPATQALSPGVHGISNAVLDAAWPKVARTKASLAQWCARGATDVEALFAVLADPARTPDEELPSTGVPLEWERRLSAPFIVGEDVGYGTRASTVVTLGRDGHAHFVERTFDPAGRQVGEAAFDFALTGAGSSARAVGLHYGRDV
jgi:uncharacterized protein with NRDE domain